MKRSQAEIAVDVAAVQGAPANRVESHPVDNLPRLGGVGHVRHDDAGGAGLEGPHVIAVAAAAHADDGVDIMDARGPDLVFQPDPVVRYVLVAQPDSINAAKTGRSRSRGGRKG